MADMSRPESGRSCGRFGTRVRRRRDERKTYWSRVCMVHATQYGHAATPSALSAKMRTKMRKILETLCRKLSQQL